MLAEAQNEARLKLCEYLVTLSSADMPEEEIRRILFMLDSLYAGGFRHCYSDFFPLILTIADESNSYSLDWLIANLEKAQALVEQDKIKEAEKFPHLHKPLLKLNDHINLEVARYQYYSANTQKLKDMEIEAKNLQEVRIEMEADAKNLQEARNELEAEAKRAASMQTQYMTILGIFAAIVLAFVGNFSFSSAALQNLLQANPCRIFVMTALVGFLFYNMLCLLLGFLKEINRLEIPWFTRTNWIFNIVIIVLVISVLIYMSYRCLA